MTKNELIKVVGTKTGFAQKDVASVIDTVIDSIIETVANGESVNITGFGKFEVSNRAARTGFNPATGQPMEIAACSTPKFKAGTTFKQALK